MSVPIRIATAVGGVVGVDLAAKLAAARWAGESHTGALVPVHNAALSLGIVSGPQLGLLAFAAAAGIAAAAVVTIPAATRGRLPVWIPVLLLGGALANLVDRALSGAVHDFVATPWIVLNLADVAVVAGVLGLVHHRVRRKAAP